jgi:hypothetical protein
VIKDTTCLLLVIPGVSPSLSFKFFVTSLLITTIHIDRQRVGKNNITPKMEINHTIIFYVSLRDRRIKNH